VISVAKRGAKEFYKSKTVYFGALFIIIAIANFFGFAEFQPSAEVSRISEVLIGVIIIALRFKTDKPVKIK